MFWTFKFSFDTDVLPFLGYANVLAIFLSLVTLIQLIQVSLIRHNVGTPRFEYFQLEPLEGSSEKANKIKIM